MVIRLSALKIINVTRSVQQIIDLASLKCQIWALRNFYSGGQNGPVNPVSIRHGILYLRHVGAGVHRLTMFGQSPRSIVTLIEMIRQRQSSAYFGPSLTHL